MTLKEKAESKAKEYQVADVCRVWNGGCPNVRHASMEMFEWTKQELIDKAYEWIDYNNRNGGCNFDGWEEDFKNYMKGEYV